MGWITYLIYKMKYSGAILYFLGVTFRYHGNLLKDFSLHAEQIKGTAKVGSGEYWMEFWNVQKKFYRLPVHNSLYSWWCVYSILSGLVGRKLYTFQGYSCAQQVHAFV